MVVISSPVQWALRCVSGLFFGAGFPLGVSAIAVEAYGARVIGSEDWFGYFYGGLALYLFAWTVVVIQWAWRRDTPTEITFWGLASGLGLIGGWHAAELIFCSERPGVRVLSRSHVSTIIEVYFMSAIVHATASWCLGKLIRRCKGTKLS